MHYIYSGSGGNTQYPLQGGEFYSGRCNAVSHRILFRVFDGLSRYSCLLDQCSWVYYGPLWWSVEMNTIKLPVDVPVCLSRRGITAEFTCVRTKSTSLMGFASFLISVTTSWSPRWGGAVLTLCTWVISLQISSLYPECLGHQHSNLSFRITCE